MAGSRSIESILERQGRFWEVRRRLAEEGGAAARRALAHLPEGPWISVSRQLGTGGLELAQGIADRLHWQVFDREILAAIADQTRAREAVLSQLDEHSIGGFDDYVRHLFVPDDPGRLSFLHQVVRVMWGLARRGNALLVGRGANWFLDPRYGLRVRFVARLDERVARTARAESIAPDAARDLVARNDADQAAFIRQSFGRDINDPHGYDLVVNVEHFAPDAIVELVLDALRRKLQAAG